jgi:hypothetical protein
MSGGTYLWFLEAYERISGMGGKIRTRQCVSVCMCIKARCCRVGAQGIVCWDRAFGVYCKSSHRECRVQEATKFIGSLTSTES